jgi:hypothetical protein
MKMTIPKQKVIQGKASSTACTRTRGRFASLPGIPRLWPGSTRGIYPPNPLRAGKATR